MVFINRKVVSIGLSLLGLILVIFSFINVANIIFSYFFEEESKFMILDQYIGPFAYMLTGVYLLFSRKKLLTFFIKQNEKVFWNITYLIIVFIGFIFLIIGICDLISTGFIFLFGDLGDDIIDNYIHNYVYTNIEIRTPLIYITTGVVLIMATPLLTQYITRKANI
ncbi:hypothetical protein FHS16_001747 [Paenibacillus endophyticus]|uniref:Uncharacterized protein n=1 Tax=Paenibacillus endophyticus TaxID=1294268 RepID=A0A7W5C5X2_9BACL|nr:hypothetical protein [Paenibacillus endophyticus]